MNELRWGLPSSKVFDFPLAGCPTFKTQNKTLSLLKLLIIYSTYFGASYLILLQIKKASYFRGIDLIFMYIFILYFFNDTLVSGEIDSSYVCFSRVHIFY